jgi:A118 family predicted phage portal protein
MLHIPLAADIATTSADLLFSDPVQIKIMEAHLPTAVDGSKTSQDRLDWLIEDDNIQATLLEAAEASAALGGVFLRVTWDKDVEPDHPLLTTVHADSAVPEFTWGRLTAVTFWRVINVGSDKESVWRHLERHEPGYVLHGLYEGSSGYLGEPRSLALMGPDWTVSDQMASVDDGVVETGITDLTAVYVPNMRPNRTWRGSALGRSDYDGVEAIMDSLDECWTSWMRDLRLGRARIMVPQEYLDAQGHGKGAIFDLDQEVFETLPMAVARDENVITPNQFAIRSAEHLATAAALLDRIVAAAGYSAATFGLEEVQRGVTATEIISRERRSIITRGKKILHWKKPLAKILWVMQQIDAQQNFAGYEPFKPRIDWLDAVQEDPGKMSATVVTLRQAMAASTETLVKMVHETWTPEEVQAEVNRIMDEQQRLAIKPGGPVGTGPGKVSGPGTTVVRGGHGGDTSSVVPTQFRRSGAEAMPPGSTQGGSE